VIDNNKSEPDQTSDLKKPTEHYNINGKIFVIADSMNIQVENGQIFKSATTSEPASYGLRYLLTNYLLPKNKAEEIDIRNEKWIHPHLCKELKKLF
jgi:hypothetical protein